MEMAGTTNTNIMEGMETSDYGVVCKERWHVATSWTLVCRTSHKAKMEFRCEGTGNMAPDRQQQVDTT
jgi:hypothetical protein